MPAIPPLVDPDWVADRLDDPALRLADCRFDLVDPPAARRAYEAGHLPGAVFVDLDADLSGPASERDRGRHPLPSAAAFAAAMARVGIGPETLVVAYDGAMSGGAARLWWLLRHFGHERAAVLRDGLAGWGGTVESGPGERPAAVAPFVPRERAGDTADAGEVGRRLADPAFVLVDARAPERYRGEVEPIDPVAGHIPGARNVPGADAWAAVDPALLDAPGEIVAYCGSGVTACLVVLGLTAAGRDDARLYPGSWSDWIARDGAVARG